jgi:hypothetical protein
VKIEVGATMCFEKENITQKQFIKKFLLHDDDKINIITIEKKKKRVMHMLPR